MLCIAIGRCADCLGVLLCRDLPAHTAAEGFSYTGSALTEMPQNQLVFFCSSLAKKATEIQAVL
jgi:hypothetical protein